MSKFFSKVTNFISNVGKTKFPYQITKKQFRYGLFVVHECHKSKTPNLKNSVLIYKKSGDNLRNSYVKNFVKNLKKLKHPNIIEYVMDFEDNEKIYLVIENVIGKISAKYLQKEEKSLSKIWSILNIAKVLQFLHNNHIYLLKLDRFSFLISKEGNWKLIDFSFFSKSEVSKVESSGGIRSTQATPIVLENLKRFYSIYVNPSILRFRYFTEDSIPPEIKLKKYNVMARYSASVDLYCFGILISQVYAYNNIEEKKQRGLNEEEEEGEDNEESEDEGGFQNLNVNNVPNSIAGVVRRFLNNNPSERGEIEEFINLGIFKNEIFELLTRIENIHVEVDKNSLNHYLDKLKENLGKLPTRYSKYKILPNLFQSVLYGESAGLEIFDCMFEIGASFKRKEYLLLFLPSILKVFYSDKKKQYRHKIIENMEQICEFSTNTIVEKRIYPKIFSCLKDENPAIREVSVKSLVHVVPKIPEKLVETKLIPVILRLQKDKKRGIRTNTVIAVGLFAKSLSKRLRDKFLIPFFFRALRDPFIYSKIFSIKALINTQEYYSIFQISRHVIPMISPFTVSTSAELSKISLQGLELYYKKLVKEVSEGALSKAIEDSVKKQEEKKKKSEAGYMGYVAGLFSDKGKGKTKEETKENEKQKVKIIPKTKSEVEVEERNELFKVENKKEKEVKKKLKPFNLNELNVKNQKRGYVDDYVSNGLNEMFGDSSPIMEKRNRREKSQELEMEFPTIGKEDKKGYNDDDESDEGLMWGDFNENFGDDDEEEEKGKSRKEEKLEEVEEEDAWESIFGKEEKPKMGLKTDFFKERKPAYGVNIQFEDEEEKDEDLNLEAFYDSNFNMGNTKKKVKKKGLKKTDSDDSIGRIEDNWEDF